MHILLRLYRLPLVRNLSGAAVGAVIALLLYGVYGVGLRVAAMVLPEHEKVMMSGSDEEKARAEKLIQTALRAKKIAEELH